MEKVTKTPPKEEVIKRNPGLFPEIDKKELHPDITKSEFLERENQSYGNDLGGDCIPSTEEIKDNLKSSKK